MHVKRSVPHLDVIEIWKVYGTVSTSYLRAVNAGKRYTTGKWGVRHVNVVLEGGTFVGLIGANGAGKSTLIHLLVGATDPTEGEIVTSGLSGKDLGWCSQQTVIDWFMPVYDNVLLGARFAGYGRSQAAMLANRALSLVGLEHLADRQPDQLSGGQQQRIQIARAIVHAPSFMFLDEPTTGLDAGAAERLMQYLGERAHEGAHVLVSSHDLSLLESRCDQILLLADGNAVTYESRETFLSRFAGVEIIEITYAGTLSADILLRLEQRSLGVVANNPLEISVRRGTPLGAIIDTLGSTVTISDIHRRTPGLKEAYMSFARATSLEVQGL